MDKLKIISVVCILLLCTGAYSQSGWLVVSDSIPNFYLEAIQMTSANKGYACGSIVNSSSGSFLKTTNGGLNWQRTDYSTYSVDDISFLNDYTGYAIGYAYSPLPGYYTGKILKTTDGGNSWAKSDSISYGNFFKLKFYDINTGFIAGKNGQLYITTNGGANWLNRTLAFNWHEPQGVWCLNANIWFIGDGNKLNMTTNQGVNWVRNDSLPLSRFYFFDQYTGIASGNNYKIYKTTNSGVNWLVISGHPTMYSIALQFTDNNTGYHAGPDTYISKTTNGGYNWVQMPVNTGDYIYALSFINNLTGFVACRYGRIYKTTNGGSVFVANISNEVPDKFELGQNYPNPFNQSTIFNLQCSMKGNVSVKVFDIMGREVQTLVNETLAAGTYQVRFDGSGLASGLYYYSMSIDGKQTAVKKMVMMK